MEKIGIIAGNRKFPLLVASAAKKKNYQIVAVAVKGDTSAVLKNYVDKIYWLGLSEFSRLFEIFKAEGVAKVVMAGQISPRRLFTKEIDKDPLLKELLHAIKDKKADTIFSAVAQKLTDSGIVLLDSTVFVEEHLPKKGVLTLTQPVFRVWDDIYFGFDLAKEVAFLDIGQTVAVKNKAVVAIEALEGTDNLIRRSGKLARGGVTIVKVSSPNQDTRFDIPVIGLNTIKNLIAARGASLAFEAGKTLFIDQEVSVALAQKKGISIVSV